MTVPVKQLVETAATKRRWQEIVKVKNCVQSEGIRDLYSRLFNIVALASVPFSDGSTNMIGSHVPVRKKKWKKRRSNDNGKKKSSI